MKKSVIVILLISILLIFPLALAQEQTQEEQTQTYSGFGRFVDNVKMFFSSGDSKVMLALEIREKELNSAIVNTENGNEEQATRNLERARKKLQYVQKKVSPEIAEDVKINIDETIDRINKAENLTNDFEIYALEEEKTGLTAELIIEVDGKEGQTLTREIVKNSETGQNKVEINVEGDDVGRVVEGEVEGQVQEQTRTREIETRMNEIDDAIADIVVKDNVVENGGPVNKDDDDATPEPDVVDDGPGDPGVVDED